MWKKLAKNTAGFSLTEVMIGIMILTIAIVAASNLLVGLVRTNELNLRTMQAYYLAQEGIEGIRNIRDTNWLHNRDWLGSASVSIWGGQLDSDEQHPLGLKIQAFSQPISNNTADIQAYAPWTLSGDPGIFRNEFVLSGDPAGEDTGFVRTVLIKPYSCTLDSCVSGHFGSYVLAASRVSFSIGATEHEVVLYEILTDWKGGVL